MYKRASRTMQHALRVDTIDPTKGFIGGLDPDYIPSADNMDYGQCDREHAQLKIELARISNELEVAKRSNNAREIERLGLAHQSIQQRIGPIKQRMRKLYRDDAHQILGDVIRDFCSKDLASAIFAECRRRVSEAAA